MKRTLARMLAQGLFAAHLDALLLKDSAVVVAFHRVHDVDTGDGLSLAPALFERYCRFFKDHFNVVPLRTIVDRLDRRRPFARELAITFDDGYLDNFENAAPVLERLGLPATFFVVSRWIGSRVVPEWDRRRGAGFPWMEWRHVRSLHGRGFDIGAHTQTHPDLGRVNEASARREILGAKHDLEARLRASVDLFAYPYGGPRNIVPTSREIVRRAGFRCCCSCFGGLLDDRAEAFNLPRVPVSPWYSSPRELGFEMALRSTVQR